MNGDAPYKGTLLIVDDEPDVVFFISKMFQPLGYHTITAGSGIEALKYLQELRDRIDLVLLDLRMPEMGGIEVLKAIRRDYQDLPVMVLTAYGEKKEEVEQIGINGFMTKPYSIEELYRRIETILLSREFDKEELEPESGFIPAAKVLIVDDEKDVCEVLASTLREDVADARFDVRTACSGEEALKIAQEFEPDVAVVDIRMPHMWGDELIARFKRDKLHCPKDFIVFTAKDDHEEKKKAQDTGYKFISKSAKLEEVIQVLKKTCIKHKLLAKAS